MSAIDLLQIRLESLSQQHSDMQNSLDELISSYNRVFKNGEISKDQSNIYISNGFVNANSYLALSMLHEKESLSEIKAKHGDDGWYYLFEKIFRGSEEEITKRQSIYVSYFQECYSMLVAENEQGYFLDFGSGRGEFLSLIAKERIPGKGVDTNRLNVEYVVKKGLDAICVDGMSYLENIKNDSLFGITMFQVAEHLEFDLLKSFIRKAYRKIMPGGMILIETVNPSCIRAMQYFYLDPSHIRPYPPELLKFHAEWEGFVDVKIIFYMPVFEINIEDQSNYIGYALIGHKPIETESKLMNLNFSNSN
jgi:O-antigen chain-terminating methyltransferase